MCAQTQRDLQRSVRLCVMTVAVMLAALVALPLFPRDALAEDAGLVEMHRLYNPNSGEHFYTASKGESDRLATLGWKYEGVGWIAPASSKTPVYRLYNSYAGEHHYTTSSKERNVLVKAGWTDEKIGWYSDDAKGVQLYREYNPNAFSCNHNYTTSEKEHNKLLELGWHDEGYAWYGVDVNPAPADSFEASQQTRDGILAFVDKTEKAAGDSDDPEKKVDILESNMHKVDEHLNALVDSGDVLDYAVEGSSFFIELPEGNMILPVGPEMVDHQGVSADDQESLRLDVLTKTNPNESAEPIELSNGIKKISYNRYTYNGHAYRVYAVSGVDWWEDARDYCESVGGHLATISDAAEDKALFEIMTASGYDSGFFGLYSKDGGASWQWVDGTPFTYSNWAWGEPSSDDENYGMYYWEFDDGSWNDGTGDVYAYSFLCEWDDPDDFICNAELVKIVTVEPFKSQFGTDVFTKAAEKLAASIPEATYSKAVTDTDVTVSWMEYNLSNYNIIIWNGHGSHASDCHSVLLLSEQTTTDRDIAYRKKIKNGEVLWLGDSYAITPKFVEKYYNPTRTGRNLAYIACCASFYDCEHEGYDGSLAASFCRDGAGSDVYLGYNYEVDSSYNNALSEEFWAQMVQGRTVWDSLSAAKEKEGEFDPIGERYIMSKYISDLTFYTGKTSLDEHNREPASLCSYGDDGMALY